MKKTIKMLVLLLAMVLVSKPMVGQIKLGVTAGLNVSKLSFSDMASNMSSENRAGWFLGPKIEVKVPLVGLGIDAALQYSQRTLRGEDGIGSETSSKYKSIEIPLNIRYSMGLASLASFHLSTGPQFGFNIGNSTWGTALEEFKLKNSVVTWNVGAGLTLVKHLELCVGYNIALSKLAERLGTNPGSFKTNSWQLSLTYLF